MAEVIGLAQVAQRLKCTWARAYNLVLTGQIRGERGPNGRWQIPVSSLERYLREREAVGVTASSR